MAKPSWPRGPFGLLARRLLPRLAELSSSEVVALAFLAAKADRRTRKTRPLGSELACRATGMAIPTWKLARQVLRREGLIAYHGDGDREPLGGRGQRLVYAVAPEVLAPYPTCRVPESALRPLMRLHSGDSVLLYAFLASWPKGSCFSSSARIAADLGLASGRRLREAARRLEDAGLLARFSDGRNRRTLQAVEPKPDVGAPTTETRNRMWERSKPDAPASPEAENRMRKRLETGCASASEVTSREHLDEVTSGGPGGVHPVASAQEESTSRTNDDDLRRRVEAVLAAYPTAAPYAQKLTSRAFLEQFEWRLETHAGPEVPELPPAAPGT